MTLPVTHHSSPICNSTEQHIRSEQGIRGCQEVSSEKELVSLSFFDICSKYLKNVMIKMMKERLNK